MSDDFAHWAAAIVIALCALAFAAVIFACAALVVWIMFVERQ